MMYVSTKNKQNGSGSRRSRLGFQLETPDNEKENEECMHA